MAEGWGRLWNRDGVGETQGDPTIRASLPVRDWPITHHSPPFSTNLANIHVRGEGWSHTFIAYESSIPGVYWVSRINSNGADRRGRGGTRTAFKIYGEEGIFSRHLNNERNQLSELGWRMFCAAMGRRDRGTGALLSTGSAKSSVSNVEVITKIHPEADRTDLNEELKMIHVLRNNTLGEVETIDISDPNG